MQRLIRKMSSEETPKIYQRVKNRIAVLSVLLDLAALFFFFFSGLSFSLKEFASQWTSAVFLVNTIYILAFCLGYYVIHIPISFFTGFYWEHKFQLSKESFQDWFIDDLKRTGLSFALFWVMVQAIFLLVQLSPQSWWIYMACFWMLVSFVLAKLTPNVIVPMFYKYSTIKNQALKKRIKKLFDDSRVFLKDVYAIDFSKKTTKANAFLCGLGKQRRVVLSDTLLDQFSNEEIEIVVAHELAHYKHHDIAKMLIINFLVIFVGFYLVDQFLRYSIEAFALAGMNDISIFPLMALTLIVFGFFTTPVLNAYSRVIETAADRFSLVKTKSPQAFISMMKKLGEMNLSEFEPGLFTEIFFYDHPPIGKRIRFAESFNRS